MSIVKARLASRSSAAAIVTAAVTVGVPLATVGGLWPWWGTLVVGVAWAWVLWSRLGPAMTAAVVMLGWMMAVLVTLVVAPYVPLSLNACVAIGTGALGLVAAYRVWRDAPAPPRVAQEHRATAVAIVAGAIVWNVTAVLTRLVPHAAGLNWVTFADSTLNISAVREMLRHGGIHTSPALNPRPLEHALSAAGIPVGHASLPAGPRLLAEMTSTTITWSVLISFTCILAAALVVVVGSRGSKGVSPWIALPALAVSLAPLVGIVVGDRIRYGQLNTFLNIAVMLASVIVFVRARRSPALAVAALLAAGTILLAVWTPFAAMPVGLAVMAALQLRAEIAGAGRRGGFTIALSAAALVAYTAWITLPEFLHGASTVGSDGLTAVERSLAAQAPTAPLSVPYLASIAAACIVMALYVRRTSRTLSDASLVTVGGLAIGLGTLLVGRGSIALPWEYYPTRFALMSSIVLTVLAIGLAMNIATAGTWTQLRLPARATVGGVAAVAVLIGVSAPGLVWSRDVAFVPYQLLMGERFAPASRISEKIVAAAADNIVAVYWRDDPDTDNFVDAYMSSIWTLDGDLVEGDARAFLRTRTSRATAENLCVLASLAPMPVVAYTQDASLAAEVDALCPELGITVSPDPSTR